MVQSKIGTATLEIGTTVIQHKNWIDQKEMAHEKIDEKQINER